MELKCPKCGMAYRREDQFCASCGTPLPYCLEAQGPRGPFKEDILVLLKTLRAFRRWIDQRSRLNVAFMKAYKEKINGEIRPLIKAIEDKYGDTEQGHPCLLELPPRIFASLSRPIRFMETELRPSVGMGVFLERWMLMQSVEIYLRECCQEADQGLVELEKEIASFFGQVEFE